MRLIDGDALERKMYHEAFETDTDMQKWDSGCWIRYKMFENFIKEAPVIDRPKGEWIEGKLDLMCSNCENTQEFERFPYCPYCGAEMKGADDD